MSKISPGVLSEAHEILTPEEWRQLGRERRKFVPRSSHAEWSPPPGRPDPVTILEEQAKSRVPDLVPIRHGRMAASPFAYFRGAAAPMAWDLASSAHHGHPGAVLRRRAPAELRVCSRRRTGGWCST